MFSIFYDGFFSDVLLFRKKKKTRDYCVIGMKHMYVRGNESLPLEQQNQFTLQINDFHSLDGLFRDQQLTTP